MIVYKIPLSQGQKIVGNLQPALSFLGSSIDVINILPNNNNSFIHIDAEWHLEKYGFELPKSDIENYLLHHTAWQAFSESSENWCLVIEESINLKVSYTEIQEEIKSLSADWDVYFPFDRLRIQEQEKDAVRRKNNALINPNRQEYTDYLPYKLGFYWGSSIYFLSKNGAIKLLQVNQVRQRVDDEIINQTDNESINTFFDDVPWFDYNDQPKVKSIDRHQIIFDSLVRNSRWSPDNTIQIRKLLKTISDLGKELELNLILQGGTHLGYIRHGGIMPWDDDVDLGIEERDLNNFISVINNTRGLRCDKFIEKPTGTSFYKIWLSDGERIDGYEYRFPFVDLWEFNKVGNDLVFENGIICPNSAKYPFREVCFEGAFFWITGNSIEVLDSRYRTWRTGIRVYNYHHRLERCKGMPLRVEISVDENGRMISADF